MSIHILENSKLRLQINDFGAELVSISNKQNDMEYLWNGDPTYWKRCSPILFPIVGSVKNGAYSYQGKTYHLPQHGFARDMIFTRTSSTATSIWFQLTSNEETLAKYPFEFILNIGYELIDNQIKVMWEVTNPGNSTMYFSIGGHPGFLCPLQDKGKQSDYYLLFDNKEPLHYMLVDQTGLMAKKPFDEQYLLPTDQGLYQITTNTFDQDALIFEENQCHQVSLLTPDQKPYVTVSFDAPLFGVWSPSKKNAPFVCIEPWYGRCDYSEFEGDLQEKDYINQLESGEEFQASYTIEIN